MSRLALYLLGPPRIELNGEPVHIGRTKAMALLAYLALEGGRHRRDSLATFLWPAYDQSRARTNLRIILATLNRALGKGWLLADRETVALEVDAGLWLDVHVFRERLSSCESLDHAEREMWPDCVPLLAEAIALYRGDFMAGFTLRDSPAFDEWQFFQSEALRDEIAGVLERLVCWYSSQEEYDRAIAYARRWLALDPLQEAAQRRLMALYAQSGQRNAALRQYAECERVLREELGVSPGQETTALVERIRTGTEKRVTLSALVHRLAARSVHNLPPQATPIVGRAKELAEIHRRLVDPDCQLLTLVGPGGIGKTRLAIQAAQNLIQTPAGQTGFSNGIYFIPLAQVSETYALVPSIGGVLGLFFYGAADPRQQLLDHLQERAVLLILDNFEHLLDGVDLVSDVLATAPAAKILTTSREVLNLRQEWLYPVNGLCFPTTAAAAPNDLEAHSAVELFAQSARRANPGFSLATEKHWVVRICQLVEGMPLAIEIAAAWVRSMPCQVVAQELEKGIDVLTTSLRDIPERHQSLEAVLEKSWQLLSADDRAVLRQLSLFRGGFRREAAEMVTGATLFLLSALVDKSLLRVDSTGRYDLHELMRQFLAERLRRRRAEAAAARKRHATHYLSFLQRKERHLKGPKITEALVALRADSDNVRLAWNWAIENNRWMELTSAMESLSLFYEIQGWFLEGNHAFARAVAKLRPRYDRRAADEASASPEITGLALGVALTHQAWFQFRLGLYEQAKALVEESLAILHAAGQNAQRERARCLHVLGGLVWFQGELVAAMDPLRQSHMLFDEVGDLWGSARALFTMGQATLELGQYVEAERFLQESKAIFDAIGEQRQVVFVLSNLGRIAEAQGRYAQAETLHRKCLQLRTALGDRPGMSHTLGDLGDVARLQGQLTQAKEYYEQSLAIAEEMGNRTQAAVALWGLSKLAEMRGDYAEAKKFSEASKDSYQLCTGDLCLGWATFGLGDYEAAEQCFYDVLALVTEAQWPRKVLHALAGLAHLLAKTGKPERALELLTLILGHPGSDQEVNDRAARLQAELKTELLPEAVEAAQERGRARDLWATAEELLDEL